MLFLLWFNFMIFFCGFLDILCVDQSMLSMRSGEVNALLANGKSGSFGFFYNLNSPGGIL